eukprot:TRINITY_DN2630_c0_g3_i1.p1 TRINITY_DN2630_c0_g3~~TRINITY_DN2630_c0_g3_i1.p1  ORF type:complete len:143 (-),score=26.77 TRINITY_DN2630_c0_g3_i1:147-575(-)
MPELFVRYRADAPLNIMCRLGKINRIKDSRHSNAILNCNFSVGGDILLSTEMAAKLRPAPKSMKDTYLFHGTLEDRTLENLKTEPSDVQVSMFMSQFFMSFLTREKSVLKVPGIKYGFARKKYAMVAGSKGDHYAAYYMLPK